MQKITLNKVEHRGQQQLTLSFAYNAATKEYIKKFPGVKWSQTLKCFYVPFSKDVTNKIFLYLRHANYFVDYDSLKSKPPEKPKSNKIKINTLLGKDSEEKVLDFMEWMRQKRYSENTINTYQSMVRLFLGYYGSKPIEHLNVADIENFNTNYILANNYSSTYQNQLVNALKLFFSTQEKKDMVLTNLPRPRKQRKLPEVLSIGEIQNLLGNVGNLKHKTLLSFIYACGLRIGETLNIALNDLNLERSFVHIKSGKGHKDRYVPIPKRMNLLLTKYIQAYKPNYFLFEGAKGGKYSPVSARQVLQRALKASGITKQITLHTLRHSHATHLLENGTDLRYIQELLGHNNPKTTMLYTHVSSTSLDKIKNPFDEFED